MSSMLGGSSKVKNKNEPVKSIIRAAAIAKKVCYNLFYVFIF
jgi:hypothetical protein